MIRATDVDRVAMRQLRDVFSVAALDERIVRLTLAPIKRHVHWTKACFHRAMIHLHSDRIKAACVGARCGAVQQVFEQDRTRIWRNLFNDLVMNYVPRLRGVGERVGLRPGFATIKRMQKINVRLRRPVVQSAAVVDVCDVTRCINAENDMSLLFRLRGMHHTHIAGMFFSRGDIFFFDDVWLVIRALQVGP
jgi:hypothetical protein